MPKASLLTHFAAVAACLTACTVHHVETADPGDTVQATPAQLEVELAEEVQPGSVIQGQLSEREGVAMAHPFVARAGATVSTRLEASPAGTNVSIRGPVTGSGDPGRARFLAHAGGQVEIPSSGVYLLVVEGHEESLAGYTAHLECHSEECRAECSSESPCPDNARCFFVQCVTTPCPSFCQVDLATEPVAPVAGNAGDACGSRGLPQCGPRTFCSFPLDAACGEVDHPGQCQPVPEACTDARELICACDGRTYLNVCEAQKRGISVRSEGACPNSPEPVPVDEGTTGTGGTIPSCIRTGCSRQVCTEVGMEQNTTCEARPEYACLNDARCERQDDGRCGWTQTPEYQACIDAL